MKQSTLIAGITLLSVSLGTVAVYAGPMGPGGASGHKVSFEELDADSDGVLTKAEMTSHAQANFAERDTDGDGLLSSDEMIAAASARMRERIENRVAHMTRKMDQDGDGRISFEEMQTTRGGKLFARADADGDGQISKAEFKTAKAGWSHRGKHRMGGHQGSGN